MGKKTLVKAHVLNCISKFKDTYEFTAIDVVKLLSEESIHLTRKQVGDCLNFMKLDGLLRRVRLGSYTKLPSEYLSPLESKNEQHDKKFDDINWLKIFLMDMPNDREFTATDFENWLTARGLYLSSTVVDTFFDKMLEDKKMFRVDTPVGVRYIKILPQKTDTYINPNAGLAEREKINALLEEFNDIMTVIFAKVSFVDALTNSLEHWVTEMKKVQEK